MMNVFLIFFFFFNDTATTEIYTFPYTTLFRSAQADVVAAGTRDQRLPGAGEQRTEHEHRAPQPAGELGDRKSTRLNSSLMSISYAVFCLKKKKTKKLPK